ncbi:nuclease [Terriglobus albidus]|uniref:Nuclease n=2 Tax=Terriglobus albidus TaxID=1592106 RepID=A0A5B9ELP5_9BACT|nr:nuclease [Terriglobus albidus]
MPAFLHTPENINAVEYLGPEPDRWNLLGGADLNDTLRPEHYILLDLADMAGPLPHKRLDYIRLLAAYQLTHPQTAGDFTPEKIGLQPYSAMEVYERLEAAMREYRRRIQANEDTKPVELAIVFYAGWMGHYVGDGGNPMHTSINYNGWVQENPDRYTVPGHNVHGKLENIFLPANIKQSDVTALVAPPQTFTDVFAAYVTYLRHSHTLVEKTYQIEKSGGFDGKGTPEAVQFTSERLAAAASMLRDMIYTAWTRSANPVSETSQKK